MKFKELKWRKYNSEYRTDVKLKGVFSIRFIYGYVYGLDKYFYKWIINGKKYGDYFGYVSDTLEDAKQKCEFVLNFYKNI